MAALTPDVSLITGVATVTPWYRVTASALGSEVAGSSGDLSGTVADSGGKLSLSGTPPAVLANGGSEMTRQPFTPPWSIEDGDIVEVRWTGVAASAASSWQLGVMLSGTTVSAQGTLQCGIYGATSRGGNIGSDNASTELTESATLGEVVGLMQTSEGGNVCSVMAQATTAAGALVDANARRSVSYTVDAYRLYIVHGTVNTSQDNGAISGFCDVRRIRRDTT